MESITEQIPADTTSIAEEPLTEPTSTTRHPSNDRTDIHSIISDLCTNLPVIRGFTLKDVLNRTHRPFITVKIELDRMVHSGQLQVTKLGRLNIYSPANEPATTDGGEQ